MKAEQWAQQYRCGCFVGYRTKAEVRPHCPFHLRDRQGAPYRMTEHGAYVRESAAGGEK